MKWFKQDCFYSRIFPALLWALVGLLSLVTPIQGFGAGLSVCENEYQLKDLEVGVVNVANQDVEQILLLLQSIGYSTMAMPTVGPSDYGSVESDIEQIPSISEVLDERETGRAFACNELPVIVMPPPVSESRLGFSSKDFLGLGNNDSYSGSEDVSGDISPALHNMSKPHTGEVDQLLVFYHASTPATFQKVHSLVTQNLDSQASQVYIEGLVLEVSEGGLRQLGIQYDRINPDDQRISSIGSTAASSVTAGGSQVISFVRDTLLDSIDNPDQALLKIQALVSDGSAEVLSRPSVLTLSNRQATIQIIDIVQFPIQEATITSSGDIVQSAFTFEAVRPGITLNLRPRTSATREFVSLEIDVTVEALVPANNGEVRNDQGQVIATKPGSSARRVQTFARIPNRTPIIIGGLIAEDKQDIDNRVPLLGKIPVVGKLFGATRRKIGKREVIIVLTPYIISEDNAFTDVSVPKDTSLFDVSDNTLFIDTYRIRAEDVYDLRFLLESPDFVERQKSAERLAADALHQEPEPALKRFLGGNLPGGDKFLNRMIFDLVRRRDFGDDISAEDLIVLGESASGEPKVELFSQLIPRIKGEQGSLFIEYFSKDDRGDQFADIHISNIPAGTSWNEMLWQRSYGSSDAYRSAVIIRDQQDLETRVDAIVTAAIIDRNGGYDKLTVEKFKRGSVLTIPNFSETRFHLVDEDVARVFTDVQHYYRASAQELERAYQEIDKILDRQAVDTDRVSQ